MIYFFYGIYYLIAAVLQFKVTSIFILQYYSGKRLVLFLFQIRKKIIRFIVLLILGILLATPLLINISIDALNLFALLLVGLIVGSCRMEQFKFTRRSLILYMAQLLLLFATIYLLVYCRVYPLFALVLLPFLSLIIILANYLLFPYEELIRQYYLFKARSKLKNNHNLTIIGITGSFGKTTFKNYLNEILNVSIHLSKCESSTNTLMGLCKFINQKVSKLDQVLVVELGIDQPQGMKKFKRLFKLDYAIITSIGKMHMSTFKSLDNVLKAKLKIQELLKEKDNIFYNADDPLLKKALENRGIGFSLSDYKISKKQGLGYSILFNNRKINLQIYSSAQLINLCGAIKVATFLGLSDELISIGISRIKPPSRRGNLYVKGKTIVIDDSYNANFFGLVNAIKDLKLQEGIKGIIISGLIEQGDEYVQNNYQIGKELCGIDYILFIKDDLNHPLIEGFNEKCGEEQLISCKTYQEAIMKSDNLELDYLLITAKGSDFYLC